MTSSRFMFAAVSLLLVSNFPTAQAQVHAALSPPDLVKAVIQSELNASNATEVRWKYLLVKDVDGKEETREVVETKSRSLNRLIAIAGGPLNAARNEEEAERILRLSHNPEEQRKLEQIRKKDGEQSDAFFKMVPEAFLFAVQCLRDAKIPVADTADARYWIAARRWTAHRLAEPSSFFTVCAGSNEFAELRRTRNSG